MISLSTIKKMALAVAISPSNGKRNKHVAFIVKGGRIISVGINSERSHPLAKRLKQAKESESKCAELNACLKLGLGHRDGLPDFSGLIMVVVRVLKCGSLGMSKPCVGCQSLIRQCGFRRVYWSNEKGELNESTIRG